MKGLAVGPSPLTKTDLYKEEWNRQQQLYKAERQEKRRKQEERQQCRRDKRACETGLVSAKHKLDTSISLPNAAPPGGERM